MTNTPPPLPRSEAERLRDALLALRHGVAFSNPAAMAGPFASVTDYIDQVLADGAQPPATTQAALRTLDGLGYTYHGGELWKPPLGRIAAVNSVVECGNCGALFNVSAAERG